MGALDIILILVWFAAILGPMYWAWKEKVPISLGLVIGLLFGYITQILWMFLGHSLLIDWFWMRPSEVFGLKFYTLFSSGFLHSSPLHVLSNIVIIGLVGIPLEERLGRERWLALYFVGLFGGSICWTFANLGENTPALGASGAAFGILGSYLAGWPKDEVYFPLIIIRPWPVSIIALIYFGLEIFRTFLTFGLSQPSHIAHMAHLGGFVFAYLSLNSIAKGGPVVPGESTASNKPLQSLPLEHPFVDVDPIIKRLYEEGDQKETRQAWMEELVEKAKCPICEEELKLKNLRISCSVDKSHLLWP